MIIWNIKNDIEVRMKSDNNEGEKTQIGEELIKILKSSKIEN